MMLISDLLCPVCVITGPVTGVAMVWENIHCLECGTCSELSSKGKSTIFAGTDQQTFFIIFYIIII